MLDILISFIAFTIIHVFTMALFTALSGLKVTEISLGFGPTIFKWKVVKVKLILLSGYVQTPHPETESLMGEKALATRQNHPLWLKLLVPLSAFLLLLLVFSLIAGDEAVRLVGQGFGEIFLGAISPFGTAQTYLEESRLFAANHSFLMVFVATSCKLIAMNMLPLPGLCGGQVLNDMIQWFKPSQSLDYQGACSLFLVPLLISCSWLLATVYFFWP